MPSHRLPTIIKTPSKLINPLLSPKLKITEATLKGTQLSVPNFLSLTSYTYENLLYDNDVIEQMRSTKLQLAKAKYAEINRNTKKIGGNQLVSKLSVADLNYLKGPSQITNMQAHALNPTQIAVKSRLKATDKQLQIIKADLKKTESIENLRSTIGRLNNNKTTGNINKLLSAYGKQKLPNLKTTTINRDIDRIPYNRYVTQKINVAESGDIAVLINKENMPMNTDNDDLLSVNRNSTTELPKLGSNFSNRSRSPVDKHFQVYKDKSEINRMFNKPEQVKFDVIKRKFSVVKLDKPRMTDVDQWNMEYLQYTKN